METSKPKRLFTPEQKYEILKDIEKHPTIKSGLEKYQLAPSVFNRWRRQLSVGINASLRNSRPMKPANVRALELENKKLKEIVLNQSLMISDLKKVMSLD
jgi:transposase-like protein